jgi:hypothetical protein
MRFVRQSVQHRMKIKDDLQVDLSECRDCAAGPDRKGSGREDGESQQQHASKFGRVSGDRQPSAHSAHHHRRQREERGDFSKVQRIEERNLFLGTEEQQGGECQEARERPVSSLCA